MQAEKWASREARRYGVSFRTVYISSWIHHGWGLNPNGHAWFQFNESQWSGVPEGAD